MIKYQHYNIFLLTYGSEYGSIYFVETKQFFLNPDNPSQRQYEALRTFYIDELSALEAAKRFNYSPAYFKKIRYEFSCQIKDLINPFFQVKKKGPKRRFIDQIVTSQIIALRKQNYSISDIRMVLESKGQKVSLDAIDKILKAEGFAPLPRRTRQERLTVQIPAKLSPPKCQILELKDEVFYTERGAGPLIFLPLIENLGIIKAISCSGFPQTKTINDVSSILSFLALKLMGQHRLSHDETWGLDRALGLFARLNVLPKGPTLSSYSYRVARLINRNFLLELNRIFGGTATGEFNLDFKTIPHWGDKSVLEKNFSGSHSKVMKSVLAMIVQDPTTGYLSYTNAEIKRKSQNDAVFDFVDFWKKGQGVAPKMLIFDSKFTTYQNLNKLNRSEEQIKFLTLRRRGKSLVKKVEDIPQDQWQPVQVEGKNRKHQTIKVYDAPAKLRDYDGQVRQLILSGHGREQPTFMITNDFETTIDVLVKKYARRWLVEQEIAEQIIFFHLNRLSSSIVVKVDFDLTLTLLAHNLYRVLSSDLPGFEHCTVPTIYRRFIENGAKIKIKEKRIKVSLKKKNHLPILFELPWMKKETRLSWMKANIQFDTNTTS